MVRPSSVWAQFFTGGLGAKHARIPTPAAEDFLIAMPRPKTFPQAQAHIDALIPDAMELRAIAVLDAAMSATVLVRGPDTAADGKRIYVERPDHALRLAAAVRTLEFKRGKPAATLNLNASRGGNNGNGVLSIAELMDKNPALVAHIAASYLEAARAKAINVTPAPAENGG